MAVPNRSRDQDGTFREKRGDTKVQHLKQHYSEFREVNGNTKLDTLKDRYGVDSLDGVRKALRGR